MPYSDPEEARQRARERMRANRAGEQGDRENRENVLPQAQTGEQGEQENGGRTSGEQAQTKTGEQAWPVTYVHPKTFRAVTVARILAGSDRAELVERAGEVAQDPDTKSMILVWQSGDSIVWRNAGMTNECICFATEIIKREMFQDGD